VSARAMGDVEISGRIRTGRGPKNRRLSTNAFCASDDLAYT
jgi:hypothetical protein